MKMLMQNTARADWNDENWKFRIHPDADFEVGLRPIFNVNREIIPDKKEVFRRDTNDGLAVVSKTYKVRNYKKAINYFEDLILNSNIDTRDVEVKHNVDQNGAVYMVNYRFNRVKGIKMFDDPKERSVFELQFRSSHNMRFPEEMIAWARYLWCDNGCANTDWMLHVKNKHNTTKDITIDYKAIDDAVRNFLQGEEEKKRWIEKEITYNTVMALFQRTLAYQMPTNTHSKVLQFYSDIQMESLRKLYQKYTDRYGENLFAVFQTATDWSTHIEKTRGKVYNVQERRQSRVDQMLADNTWREHLEG